MASTVILSDNGASSGSAGIKTTGGNDGVLLLQTTTTGGTATTALTIDTSQNVGVGVTPSAWGSPFKALQIGTTGNFFASNGGNTSVTYNAYYNGTNYIYQTSDYSTRYSTSSSGHLWFTSAAGTAGSAITFTQAMTLDASGNLGVGTGSPADRVDTRFATGSGNFRLGVIANNNIKAYNTAGDLYLVTSDAASDAGLDSQRNVLFKTANTERMRITSAGGVSFGSSGTAYGTSGQVLTSAGNAPPTWTTVGAAPVDIQTFNSTGTWTKPTGGQQTVRVQIWGGGGGGGLNGGYGTGGAGGGYNEWTGAISLIATQTVTVGTGGAGTGTNGAFGGTGGTSSVAITGKTLTSTGGGGGRAGNSNQTQTAGSAFGYLATAQNPGALPLGAWNGSVGGNATSCGSNGAANALFGGAGGGTAGAGTSGYGGNGTANGVGIQPAGGGGGANAGGAGRIVITCW